MCSERTNNSNIGRNFQDIIKETFTIKLQSFSGVDRPVAFHVNISNKSFQPSEDAQNEINAFMKGDRSQPPPTNVEANLKATKRNDIVNEDKDKAVDDFVFENTHKYSTRGRKHESTVNYNDTSSDDSTDDESYSTDLSEESDDDKYDSDTKNYHYKRIRQYGPPTSDVYNESNFMSKIKVYKQQELGYVAPLADRKKNTTNPSSRNVSIQITDRRDIVARSIRYAKATITSSNYFLSESSSDPMYEFAQNYKPTEDETFPPSWARRLGHGKMYGQTYIDMYKDDIEEMFESGEAISSNKMNASKMREHLMLRYPDRFSLPGEIEIKQCISALAQKKKTSNNNKCKKKRKQCDIPKWEKDLKEMVKQRWEETPNNLYEDFKSSMGDDPSLWPIDIPTITNEDKTVSIDKKMIKVIISAAKQEAKKVGKRSLLN